MARFLTQQLSFGWTDSSCEPDRRPVVPATILEQPHALGASGFADPRVLVEGEGLPEEALTTMNAGAVGNAGTTKEGRCSPPMADEHDLADTLGHVTALESRGAALQRGSAGRGDLPCSLHRAHFRGSIGLQGGLAWLDRRQQTCRSSSLASSAQKSARRLRPREGPAHPQRDRLVGRLTWGLPRDSSFFRQRQDVQARPLALGARHSEKLLSQRAPLLAKQRSNGQAVDPEEMRQRLMENSASIDPAAQPTLEAFDRTRRSGDVSITWDVAPA